MKTDKKIKALKRSIAVQEQLSATLRTMAAPENIELSERILRSLRAMLSIEEARKQEAQSGIAYA